MAGSSAGPQLIADPLGGMMRHKPSQPIVREATEADTPQLVSLSASVASERLAWFNDQAAGESEFAALFEALRQRPNSVSLVAECEGAVVGELDCLALGPTHSEFVITIQSDFRRMGVASALLRSLLEWADGQPELTRLQARVLEPNVGSRRLLASFGFAEFRRPPHAVTIRGLTMLESLYFRDYDR